MARTLKNIPFPFRCVDFEQFKILIVAFIIFQNEEPLMTNSDDSDFAEMGIVGACLDYVWFTSDKIGALAALETPPRDVVMKYTSLPSQLFPSDHLPLAFKFYLM